MNKKYIFPIAAIAIIGAFSFQKSANVEIGKFQVGHKNASGAPAGKTGAPGEGNCTDCHSGSTQDGSTENVFILLNSSFTPVTSYVPGQSYTASVTMNSNPTKKGFQAIALNASNAMAGNFTGVAGNTAISTSGTKKYANHTSASNTSTTTTWGWTWVAPTTDATNVTFYVATNAANNNGANSGDVIYLSQHVITSTAGIEEQEQEDANFTVGYSAENNAVVINFTNFSAGDMFLNLIDLNGKSVFSHDLGGALIGKVNQTVVLPSEIKNGIYVAHLFVNNKPMSTKIMVQK